MIIEYKIKTNLTIFDIEIELSQFEFNSLRQILVELKYISESDSFVVMNTKCIGREYIMY